MISSDLRTYLEKFEGIIFDLDGTLVDLHLRWDDVRLDMHAAFNAECSEDIPETGISSLIDYALTHGCANARQIAAGVLNKHESSAPFDPVQEVVEVFRTMQDSKKIAVVTNNLHSTAEYVLKSLGLYNQNICIIGFDDVKHSKPDPQGILRALQVLDITSDQAVMIGDRDSDKTAATEAQTTFCHVSKFG